MKHNTKKLNESYIQSTPTTASTDSQVTHKGSNSPQNNSSDMILTMLNKLENSNQVMLQHIESIEQKQQASKSQPSNVATGPATQVQYPLGGTLSIRGNVRHPGECLQPQYQSMANTTHVISMPRSQPATYHLGNDTRAADPTSGQIPTRTDIQSDGVIPTLDTIKRTPSISDTVAHLLEPHEEQARMSLQGRPSSKKSGRYNTTDLVHTASEFR